MTPREPAWKRAMRVPCGSTNELPIAFSDLDPWSPAIQGANRLRDRMVKNIDKTQAILDRLENSERQWAERQRKDREARLKQWRR